MTSPGWQSPVPPPGVVGPQPTHNDSGGIRGIWRVMLVGLLVLALVATGIAAYGFVSSGGDNESAAGEKSAVKTAEPVPIDKEKAEKVHSPDHQLGEGNGVTPENSPGIGDSVIFTNDLAVRMDSIEPAKLWPNSKFDVLLGEDARIFALRYTITNFSDKVQKAPPAFSISSEPFDAVELPPEMKDVSEYQAIIESNSAALPKGSSAVLDETGKMGIIYTDLKPGETINGVFVSYEMRTGEAKIKIEVGIYRQVGVARFFVDVP